MWQVESYRGKRLTSQHIQHKINFAVRRPFLARAVYYPISYHVTVWFSNCFQIEWIVYLFTGDQFTLSNQLIKPNCLVFACIRMNSFYMYIRTNSLEKMAVFTLVVEQIVWRWKQDEQIFRRTNRLKFGRLERRFFPDGLSVETNKSTTVRTSRRQYEQVDDSTNKSTTVRTSRRQYEQVDDSTNKSTTVRTSRRQYELVSSTLQTKTTGNPGSVCVCHIT